MENARANHIEIAELEESGERALPPEEIVALGAWRLRFTRGIYRRANSVMTSARCTDARGHWQEMIAAAEGFYRKRNLPTIFNITPATAPGELDSVLAERGYTCDVSSEVHTARAEDVAAGGELIDGLLTDSRADEAWLFTAYGPDDPCRRIKAQFFDRIHLPRLFVSVRENGAAAACGVGVISMGRCWIFSMHTSEAHRRRGLARGILRQLGRWSLNQGAGSMHLQVMADNGPALKLYASCGFGKAYGYHYRVKALPDDERLK